MSYNSNHVTPFDIDFINQSDKQRDKNSERQPQVAASEQNKEKVFEYFNTDNAKQFGWYKSGQHSKHMGFERVSPFYENSTADYFFFCGFDGVSFVDAQALLSEKLKQELKKDSTVLQTVNELVDQNEPKSTDFLP